MNLYKVIFEDRDNVYREFIPARTEKLAEAYIAGNGEIVSIADVTEQYPIRIDCVVEALRNYGFGKVEIDTITRMVQKYSNCI